MSEARTCSQCGTPLNNDAPEGFCPTCMLEGALRLGGVDERVSSVEGRRFGDYELLDEIARGGMGIVYRARQISLNRIVAVKFILIGHFADKSMVRRFKAEAAAAAKLRHSNIVAIHEIGEEAGQHFFSMDYVEGANLADFMRHQPVSTRQAAQLLKTISEALHYAHEQGIVHRDLKPSNILIDGLLEPRITDFGLAKDLKVDSDLTLTGQMLGSPNYISPEQASGKIAVGVPSDIYSLGAILYHLLTARPPFAGETLTDTLNQVATGEAVSPRLLNPSVPRDLETLCLKCLEKEPGSRYPSAQELAEELNRFLDDEPIHARPIAAPARMWRWCRRKPVVAGLTAAVFVSIVLGFIGVLWQWNQSEAHRRLAEQKVEESRRNLYVADMILAQGALEAGNTGHAEELLRKYRPRRGEKDLRGWEWRYTWAQSRSDELFTLEQHFHPVTSLALSSDARTLASGSLDETVELWDLVTKQRIRTLLQSYVVFGMAFSNDGKDGQDLGGLPRQSLRRRDRVRNAQIVHEGKTHGPHDHGIRGHAWTGDGHPAPPVLCDEARRLRQHGRCSDRRFLDRPARQRPAVGTLFRSLRQAPRATRRTANLRDRIRDLRLREYAVAPSAVSGRPGPRWRDHRRRSGLRRRCQRSKGPREEPRLAFSCDQLRRGRRAGDRLSAHSLGPPRARYRVSDFLHPRQHFRRHLFARVARRCSRYQRARRRPPDQRQRCLECDRPPERASPANDLDLRDRHWSVLRDRSNSPTHPRPSTSDH